MEFAGSSGLGREVGTRAERARGVKRGHRGHLEIIGNLKRGIVDIWR